MNAAVADTSTRLTRRLLRHRPRILSGRRGPLGGFEERLYERWKEALDLYELCVYLAGKCGDMYRKICWTFAQETKSNQFIALTRLHGNAILIAGEVLHLLKGGFASGAHARWRSLHETAAVAMFIARGTDDLAERFLKHRFVKAYEDAQQFQKHAARLGEPELSPEELLRLRTGFDEVLRRYGADFAGSYGWAKRALENLDPQRKGNVNFGEVEKAVGIEFWVPYYRMASHSIHPTATTINFNIGGLDPVIGILTGPSNAGLADPGHGALLSLANETAVLMTNALELTTGREELQNGAAPGSLLGQYAPSMEIMAMTQSLAELARVAGDAFIRAHKQLESEENQKRAAAEPTSPAA